MSQLQELLNNVSKKDKSYNSELFEHHYNTIATDIEKFSNRISEAWLMKWRDGDTYVGLQAYYLDDTLIAVTYQTARKNRQTLCWIDDQSYHKMRDFMWEISYQPKPEFYLNDINDNVFQLLQSLKQSNDYYNSQRNN